MDFICKVGGSVLSNKGHFETLLEDNIETVSNRFLVARKLNMSFVVVHGAG